MAKSISLRKMWHLCNEAIKLNLNDSQKNSAAMDAYKLLLNNESSEVVKLRSKFGSELKLDQIEPLCIAIEIALNLPIKDGDFLIETNDRLKSVSNKSTLVFYLHNIRSGFNIGSMMRLADGFNIQSVIISGYTADITNPQVKRASLGAEKNIQILADDENKFELKKLIQQNYTIIALETAMPNEAIEQTKFTNNTVIIVGNEKNGVPESLLNLCNKIVKIPMHGIKNSLNVVSALSITCYEWNKQCR